MRARVDRPIPTLRRTAIDCVVLLIVLTAVGVSIIRLNESQRSAVNERLVIARAAEIRAELGDQLSQSVSLARGLRSFVVANPDLGDPVRFKVLLAELFDQGDNIDNIGLAPDNVLQYIHPLAGNEDAIGLRYEDVPEQFASVDRAFRTRSTVLAGPIDLVQGGRGLVDRTPVFLRDGRYWGMVSLVLDVDDLFANVEREVGSRDLVWGVRTVRSTFAEATFVGGDASVFDDPDTVLQMRVPDGTWELGVIATIDGSSTSLSVLWYLLAVVVAAAIALLVFQTSRDRVRVAALATRDALTGLPNRRLLDERGTTAIAMARRDSEPVALLFLDLDRFKPINDTHGHEAGDHVLRVVGDRIRDVVRESDTIARVGGDEFVVLLPRTDRDGADRVAAKVAEGIQAPIEWSGRTVTVTTSLGVAVYPEDGDDLTSLSSHADAAMYAAKSNMSSTLHA